METGENDHANNGTLLCGYIYIRPFSLVVHGDRAKLSFRTNYRYGSSHGFSAWYFGLEDPLTGIEQVQYITNTIKQKKCNMFASVIPVH